ncbi:hypothetical protein DM860_013100 [Cuscuta australis]|uniref:SAP domain-containing protein n=1 Tax=Cuscuta australis TaxID=267555 RepID=A0A328D7Q0_9ASTE|nr:hypothetical protein DM860_013100 [Cuscuta australis]
MVLKANDKVAKFRVKELKDALTKLALPKQGKKQVQCQSKKDSLACRDGVNWFKLVEMVST